MFEPKCDWWRKIKCEDKTVLLKGILSIKRKDYGSSSSWRWTRA